MATAEKGYCGTSGVTATAGPGHWRVPPDPKLLRAEAIGRRFATAFGLADSERMERILDTTWRTLATIAGYYDFDSAIPRFESWRPSQIFAVFVIIWNRSRLVLLGHSEILFPACSSPPRSDVRATFESQPVPAPSFSSLVGTALVC